TNVTTSANLQGTPIDMSNATGPLNAVLQVGTAAGSALTLDVKMQANTTSATTGFTDIPGATFTQVTTSGGRQTLLFNLPAGNRYVRCTGTCGTLTGAMLFCDIWAQKKLTGTTDSGVSRSPSS